MRHLNIVRSFVANNCNLSKLQNVCGKYKVTVLQRVLQHPCYCWKCLKELMKTWDCCCCHSSVWSLSCVQSLQNWDLSHPLIAEILCRVHGSLNGGASAVFMWVPSRVLLAVNSAGYNATKAALLLPVSNLTLPHSAYKSSYVLRN